MAEITTTGPMTGAPIEQQQSATIQNAKKAQWTVMIGTLLTFLLDHMETIQNFLMMIVPPAWYGVMVAAVQLITAIVAVFFGKKAIDGRIAATQRIVVTKKDGSTLNMFLIFGFVLMFFMLIDVGRALAQPRPITFKWTYTGQAAPDGFRIYQGASPAAVTTKIADVAGGATRQFVLNRQDATPLCYGLSAFNADGESDIVTKRDDGTPVCLGKPAAPTAFSS